MRWDEEPSNAASGQPSDEPFDFTPVDAAGRMRRAENPPDADAEPFSFAPINYADRLRQPLPRSTQHGAVMPPLRPGDRYAVNEPSYPYPPAPQTPSAEPTPGLPFAPDGEADQAAALQAYQQQYWAHLRELSATAQEPPVPDAPAPWAEPVRDPFAHTDMPVAFDAPIPTERRPAHGEATGARAVLLAKEEDLPRAVPVKQAVENAQAIPAYLQKAAAEPPWEPSEASRQAARNASRFAARETPLQEPPPARPLAPAQRFTPEEPPVEGPAPTLGTLPFASSRHRKIPRPPKPPTDEAPRNRRSSARQPLHPREPIPPQPTPIAPEQDTRRLAKPPRPPRPKPPLWRAVLLWGCIAAIAVCTVLVGLMVVTLLRNDREVETMLNQYYQQNGESLAMQASRVEVLPAGQTYVPTATPVPVTTATPTLRIEIHDGALGPLTTPGTAAPPSEGQPYTLAPAQRTQPAAYASLAVRQSMALLRQQYPELVAWLTVGDLIDAPVAQSTNAYYQTHNAKRQASADGAVYLDEHCSLRTPPENMVVRGSRGLLSALLGYRDAAFWAQYGVLRLDTLYEEAQYVVFAAFEASSDPTRNTYFNYAGYVRFGSDSQFTSYVQAARARSLWAVEVDVQPSDRLLTLAVPGDAQGDDLVIMARMLRADEGAPTQPQTQPE